MHRFESVNRIVKRISEQPIVAKFADVMEPGADEMEKHPAVHDVLTGKSLTGHPLHPSLVHLPIGVTVAAAALELAGSVRHRSAVTLLTGISATAAIPTAVTGMAEWTRRRQSMRQRRVGALHALAAEAGTTLALLSWVLKVRNADAAARWMLFGAVAAYGTAGFLGGDLVYGRDAAADGADLAEESD